MICECIKKDGVRCHFRAKPPSPYCGIHKDCQRPKPNDGHSVWNKITTKHGHTFYSKEMGGGGDCLYYSLLGGIQEIFRYYKPNDPILNILRTKNVLSLRRWLSGDINRKKFIENLRAINTDPKEVPAILKTGFRDEGYWYGYGFTEDETEQIRKATRLDDALRIARRIKNRSDCWGSLYDVIMFEKRTGIRVVVLQDRGEKIFYCKASDTVDEQSYVLLLYNVDEAHYQLGGIRTKNGTRSVMRPADVPSWLAKAFKKECRSNI
jgi:hypothetical protein